MALSTITNSLQVRDNYSFALTPPTSVNNYVLAANTPLNINVSDLVDANSKNANVVQFAATSTFYVKWNGTGATVPAANIINGTGLELTPSTRRIGADVTSFSIVSPEACVIALSIFTLIN